MKKKEHVTKLIIVESDGEAMSVRKTKASTGSPFIEIKYFEERIVIFGNDEWDYEKVALELAEMIREVANDPCELPGG